MHCNSEELITGNRVPQRVEEEIPESLGTGKHPPDPSLSKTTVCFLPACKMIPGENGDPQFIFISA